MNFNTILLLILALVVAAALAWYQYLSASKSRVNYILFGLRTLILSAIILLIINPKIIRNTYTIHKPILVVGVDNSQSIAELKEQKTAQELLTLIQKSAKLNDKYDIVYHQFDQESSPLDSLTFNGAQTRIDLFGKSISNLYKNKNFPTLLISDGNQTSGYGYWSSFSPNTKLFPIVLGDTLTHLDLRIDMLNANKYAFYKNQFPVEVFVSYQGAQAISTNLEIENNGQILHREKLNFGRDKKSAVVDVLLSANQLGVQKYTARVVPISLEKNTYNNSQPFAVEIIDQRTEVLIVSEINHPDLGALHRSISSQEQYATKIIEPTQSVDLASYQVVIFYQPTQRFKNLFQQVQQSGKNYWIITGKSTDYGFLNGIQQNFTYQSSGQKEDYLAEFNPQFSAFLTNDIGYNAYPPLENLFGRLDIKGEYQSLLDAKIRNHQTGKPLFYFSENNQHRSAYLLGEGLWKWRLMHYKNQDNFTDFDQMITKCIQYLNTNSAKKQLVVTHQNFYNQGESIEILAQYFNKNYELDLNSHLSIRLENKASNLAKTFDLIKTNSFYKVNLDGLAPGHYTFKVSQPQSGASYNGSFEVLEFNLEKQFTNANLKDLQQLAAQNNGKVFTPKEFSQLEKLLLEDQDYKAIQKKNTQPSPLIDWWLLLALLIVGLSAEWFTRKYHGLL